MKLVNSELHREGMIHMKFPNIEQGYLYPKFLGEKGAAKKSLEKMQTFKKIPIKAIYTVDGHPIVSGTLQGGSITKEGRHCFFLQNFGFIEFNLVNNSILSHAK